MTKTDPTTEEELWQAVGANPADSMPRLVLADWSVGMIPVTLAGRLRRGMSPAEAISKPVRSTKGGV